MQTPPAESIADRWTSRVASWNRFVAAGVAFLAVGLIQTAILTLMGVGVSFHDVEFRDDMGKVVITSSVMSLPSAITALCALGVAMEVCSLLGRNELAEARLLCRQSSTVLLVLHGMLMGVVSLLLGPIVIILMAVSDLGFQMSLLMMIWSQWLPRNEMERYLNEKPGE